MSIRQNKTNIYMYEINLSNLYILIEKYGFSIDDNHFYNVLQFR